MIESSRGNGKGRTAASAPGERVLPACYCSENYAGPTDGNGASGDSNRGGQSSIPCRRIVHRTPEQMNLSQITL
jgi:hypothetical protein